MAKLGVIVPIYNVEKYLPRCLESIYSQSFNDFELVLVDDGTQDSSSSLSDETLINNKNAIVIHKTNGGLSHARNAGIDFLCACRICKWVTFIDSDDYIRFDCFKKLYEANYKNDTNVSVCKYTRKDFFVKEEFTQPSKFESRKAFLELNRECYAWGKLINFELFDNYSSGGQKNDLGFQLEKFSKTNGLYRKLFLMQSKYL